MVEEVVGVVGGEFAEGGGDGDWGALEGALGQLGKAVADVGDDGGEVEGREAVVGAHEVGGGGQVAAGVDEGAIEVEEEEGGAPGGRAVTSDE